MSVNGNPYLVGVEKFAICGDHFILESHTVDALIYV